MNQDDVKKQATALVTYLRAQPEPVLTKVLGEFGVTPAPRPMDRRHCGICGLRYPAHKARWADDHDFEATPR